MKYRDGKSVNAIFYATGPVVFFSMLFLAQPFLSFFGLFFYGLITGKKTPKFLIFVALFGACYLGLINTTKLPESDYLIYLQWYSAAQKLSIFNFLSQYTREPLYYIYLYTIANIPCSSEQLFVFISTVTSYFVMLIGVIRLNVSLGMRGRLIISIIVFLLFFAPLFSLSAHLMRQFMSASLLILFFSDSFSLAKKRWWILVVAFFVHSSAFIFLPIAMIKKSDKTTSVTGFFLYLGFLPLAYFVSKSVAPFLIDVPVVGVISKRIIATYAHDLGHLNFEAITFIVVICLLSIWNLVTFRRIPNAIESSSGWEINVGVTILSLVILVANLRVETTEVAIRFFFYLYFFMGLIISMFMSPRQKKAILFVPLVVLFVVYFFYNLQFGVWQYAPLFDLLFAPAWILWSY